MTSSQQVSVSWCSLKGEMALTRRFEPLEGQDEDGRDCLRGDLAVPHDVSILETELYGLLCVDMSVRSRESVDNDVPFPESRGPPPRLALLAVTVARSNLRSTMTALCI
jgi:hypothetical protein